MSKPVYTTLQQIVDQLEYCDYESKDSLNRMEDNVAFVALKERAAAEAEEAKRAHTPNIARKEILLCSYTGFCLANQHGVCTDACFCTCQRKTSSVA